MKKILLTVALVFAFNGVFAQTTEKENLKKNEEAAAKKTSDIPDGWKKTGNVTFLFNQSAFNNDWLGGGTSNIAGNVGLNYDFNYKKGNIVWDNKFIAAYGLTKNKGAANVTKTDDRLELNSLWGKKASGNWYYSVFFNFKTQMDSGFDGTGLVKTSHFFSPAYFQFGPGMLWKKSDNLKVNVAPATSRLIIVHDEFTALGSAYGVEQGKTSRYEFGASVSGYYKATLMENVTMENIVNLYSNYLDNPQNIDIDYQMNLVMKVNKYMSANISVQAIKDDNASKYVQVRELFGFGINYGF